TSKLCLKTATAILRSPKHWRKWVTVASIDPLSAAPNPPWLPDRSIQRRQVQTLCTLFIQRQCMGAVRIAAVVHVFGQMLKPLDHSGHSSMHPFVLAKIGIRNCDEEPFQHVALVSEPS